MNVENRKLFRNKDARSRLASMGGIMGSSPELLGTVQKFQEAGPVAPSTFLVQLPGLVGGNEFLQLTAAELQLLNEKQPGLMTSEGVMIQEATPEILSNLNPAQVNTTDSPKIKRMFAELGVELPQAEATVEAEGPGIIDRFKSMFATEESPFIFSDTTGVSRDGRSNAEILAEAQALIAPESQVDTSITLPEQPPTTTNESIFSSIGDTMRSNPLRDAIATGRETMAETQKQRDLQEFFSKTLANQQQAMPGGAVVNSSLLSSIGDTMRSNPLRDAIATGRETMAETQKQRGLQEFFSETLANQQQAMPGGSVVNPNLLSGDNFSNDPTTGYSYPTDIVTEPLMPETTGISSLPVIAPDPVIEADRLRTTAILQGRMPPAMESEQMLLNAPSLSEMSISELEAERISRKKPISSFFSDTFNSVKNSSSGLDAAVLGALGTAASATGNEKAGAFLFDLQKEFETLKKKKEPKSRQRKLEIEKSVKEVTDELDSRVLNPEVGGPEVTSEAIAQAVEETEKEKAAIKTTRSFDANKIIKDRETAAAKFADEEVNRQGPNFVFDPAKIQEEIDKGGSGSDSIIGDITGTKQSLTPKESVKAYQAMYKEMLGMDDEDEEKEKWHQMAMIGFAIAAGQDPNALSNIAGGLLEGTKMARKDRVRKKDRDDKFTMMAIQSADEDRRTALAAGVRADERSQDQLNRIALTDLETRQRLKDESRKSKQSLQLYEDKLKIAQMFETPQSILKTDPAMAIISKAFDGVDYDMLGTGENAFSALEKMGFPKPQLKKFSRIVFPGEPYGGSGGVGKGVTGTGAKLTDIPD